MAAASSATEWDVRAGAGAGEPGAAAVTVEANDDLALRAAFYNVGIKQQDLDTKKNGRQ